MPVQSDLTTELGIELMQQLDAIGEALKEEIGWPPLGVTTLSPSGLRAREHSQAQQLGDYLAKLGPQQAVTFLQEMGQQIIDGFGVDVLQEAAQIANAEFLHERGADGTETLLT